MDKKREFLDFGLETDSVINERIDNILRLNKDEGEQDEIIGNEVRSGIPPWKVKPVDYNDNIIRKAKDFLSMCNKVGDETIIDNKYSDRKVVMDVHLGVFDVNGKIPEDNILKKRDIVDVPIHDFPNEGKCVLDGAYEVGQNSALESEDSDDEFYIKNRAREIIERAIDKKSMVQVISSSYNESYESNSNEMS
ncbi:hypothetical protein RS030_4579 [Cryptosporidium xiaoi]|uniref:Uncharacterized protein n=1 Tax=Cryptosporidium xiaoi TaxID=659607 RepID=A0AAV9Y198_9CRYT